MFTKAKDLYGLVSYRRRRMLSTFIHELKKLCGRKYHACIVEMLEDCDEDYVFVARKSDEMYNDVVALCDEYGIPRSNIVNMDYQIEIALYTDF